MNTFIFNRLRESASWDWKSVHHLYLVWVTLQWVSNQVPTHLFVCHGDESNNEITKFKPEIFGVQEGISLMFDNNNLIKLFLVWIFPWTIKQFCYLFLSSKTGFRICFCKYQGSYQELGAKNVYLGPVCQKMVKHNPGLSQILSKDFSSKNM